MAAVDDAQLLSKIQDTYVPFLKKLIAFLEKNKKATPENLTKLKAIYTIFTTSPSSEQVETFHANKKKLENWYNKAQKEKQVEDGETKGRKRTLVLSDTESSQGAADSGPPTVKRSNFANSFSDSSQPAITLVQSVNTNSSTTPIPISQIKKEKVDLPRVVQKTVPIAAATPPPPVVTAPPPSAPDPAPPADGPISFTCASCQFQTKDETEFMKHARTDHRTDLSMWCKQCGKCFSNAGVLVSHIKERACTKEEMIYKCGVKDCIFETTSGQTFVHHLRHCHKGSPFIYCVHCQKIFTLPHCLILHMQDDCPFKDKNRRNPGAMPVANDKSADPKTSTPVASQQPVITQVQQVRSAAPITYSPRPTLPAIRPAISSVRPSLPLVGTSLRSRGRNFRSRGRGRGRVRISDSSDSDDPDDPSWRPEELLGETGLRRSGRWAKKINDVRNPEPSTSGVTTSAKKAFPSAELNTNMINCPCCDFMAAFQSVLEDHYIANHKLANKNACLACNLKFESTRSFLDHFEEHRKGALPNKPPTEIIEASKPADKPKQVEPPAKALSTPAKPQSAPAKPSSAPNVPASAPNVPANAQSVTTSVQNESEPYDDVLMSIADAKLADPKSKDAVKIPYQAAILDKNLKDSKLKKFEELKSPSDLIAMKNVEKLKHFFKCGMYNCTYTTDATSEFSSHLLVKHEGKRYFCCYCLKEYLNCDSMANHMIINHNKRTFQCSKCLYRGYSKHHVQIHIKNFHDKDTDTEIFICEQIENPNKTVDDDDVAPEILDTTWPYICAIGDCSFNSYNPKEFKRHNETVHRTVSVFFCHYCKVDFLTFKRLMNHYRLHGLNTFQCNYCIHGADTKEEILLHLCNAHADSPLKAYMRGSQEEASSEVKQLNTVISEDSNDTGNAGSPLTDVNASSQNAQNKLTGCEKELYHVIDNKYYPEELQLACFPRYTRNIISDVICGIPSCEGKFESMSLYLSHLRNIHDSLNFPCPHCPEVFDDWEEFKGHLLCHGSKLYTCGTKDCEFYHFNKEKAKEHAKEHTNEHTTSESNVLAVREYTTEIAEEQIISALELTCEIPHVENKFVCLFCSYKSSDRSIMKNHLYKELAYMRFSCRLCDKKYLSRKDVKNHFINAHSGLDIICSTDINPEVEAVVKTILEMQDKFKEIGKLADLCVTCCRKIKNPLRLQSHMYICLQKEYRPYECSRCKNGHVNILALRYHTEQEHHPDPIDFSVVKNYAIEDDIGKNVLRIRLQQLKEIFRNLEIEIANDDGKSKLKFYTCSVCPFEADHKFSVQKHIKEQHRDTNGVVIKAMHRLNSCDNLSQSDENSNDSPSNIKRYSCGFCIRKMYTIQEMENHMKNSHPSKNAEEYFYYFNPDADMQFPPEDKDTYECAYCKSSRENLFSLKKHSDLMHSEMEFKVKGFVSRVQSQNYLACGHCYIRLKNMTEFHQHSTAFHPLLLPKYIGDAQINKAKRSSNFVEDIPNKRVKLGSTVYECRHCGGAFSTNEQVIGHSNRVHKSLKIEFRIIDQTNSADSADLKFYKCEFCRFTSERQYLDKHLASKHKMRVTCSYCNKRFEFASKLKEHHDVVHKDLPLKYSQETVGAVADDLHLSNNDKPKSDNAIPEPFSYYGTRPEPLDLSSLTVHMDTKEGESAKLSVVYVTELFNMFPKVVVKDIKKMENKVEIE